MKRTALRCLTGIGQVFLQESPVTGLFFVAGLLASSPLMCAGALLGAAIATLTAVQLKYPEKEIDAGLYGFNAALVGIALPFFFYISATLLALIVAGSILSTLLMHWQLRKFPLPAYTSSFVVTTWILYAAAQALHLPSATHGSFTDGIPDFGILDGIGQVMFQQNVITGLLFAIGILFHSRLHGAWAIGGSVAGALTAAALGCPPGLIAAGIFAYNGVLCAIAMAGRSTKDAACSVACAVLSVFVLLGFQKAGCPALTAPFVIASWIFTVIRRRFL